MRAAPKSAAVPAAHERSRSRALLAGGTTGNELLTNATGALLIVVLAVIGVTILRIHQLLWLHLFVGMLLVGPLALKLASTGYRFARYYTHDASYRHKGAPPTALRLLAPVVVITTVVVMVTGVALLFAGPQSRDAVLPIHKASFFVWVVFMGVHVLAHLPETTGSLRADYARASGLGAAPAGHNGRAMALASALALGLVVALVCIPEFAPWLHAHFQHH